MSKLTERITDLPLRDDPNEALRVSGGNVRVAIGALIPGQRSLREAFADRISAGYVQRGLRP